MSNRSKNQEKLNMPFLSELSRSFLDSFESNGRSEPRTIGPIHPKVAFPDFRGFSNVESIEKMRLIENDIFKGFNFSAMVSIILSFNFFRLSELQELLFVYYFMWHSLFLRSLYFK